MNFEAIADTLSNIFDLETDDLEADFHQVLILNDIILPQKTMNRIFEDYLSLDPLLRSSPAFDRIQFVKDRCTSLNCL
jgi:hypothetical protein